jgi:subtilase family serine protease
LGQYLKSTRMEDCYEFYQEDSYDIPTFLSINNFLKRNDINGNDIVNVLRTANDIINLNQTLSNLKTEIEKLKQTKNNYSLNQNTNYKPLLPLGLPRHYYRY